MSGKLNERIRGITAKGIRKLKSKTGASLSMALLLFLVCAVIGAVVLTAATAAAGRASKMAESEQRYFSVTSAGELLVNELCGKPVTIVRTKETVTEVTTEYDDDGNKIKDNSTETEPTDTFTTTINDNYYDTDDGTDEIDISNMSFLTARAASLLFGDKLELKNAFDCSFSESVTSDSGEFNIILNDDENELSEVSAGYNLISDGTLLITLESGDDNDKYTLVLTLKASFNEEESSTTTDDIIGVEQQADNGFSETKKITTTTVKTSTVTWSVIGIE